MLKKALQKDSTQTLGLRQSTSAHVSGRKGLNQNNPDVKGSQAIEMKQAELKLDSSKSMDAHVLPQALLLTYTDIHNNS